MISEKIFIYIARDRSAVAKNYRNSKKASDEVKGILGPDAVNGGVLPTIASDLPRPLHIQELAGRVLTGT
jgi:hypothetical protein